MSPVMGSPLPEATVRVRQGLRRAARAAAELGLPAPEPHGQVIRPLVAYAVAEGTMGQELPERFWDGALAVQMVHEASLVHDDVVDGAALRRGEPTVVAARGVGAALIHGDHLLTAAYRMAARTGSLAFVELFTRAVERTVAGELAQGRCAGESLDLARYREIVAGKSGELLGCAMALAPSLAGRDDWTSCFELGRRIGVLYQMLDDLLDYCPGADTGKSPLGDYAQARWTWPLDEIAGVGFRLAESEIVARLHADEGGSTPMRRCLARLNAEFDEVARAVAGAPGGSALLGEMLAGWRSRAHQGVAAAEAAVRRGRRAEPSPALRARVPVPGEVQSYLGLHSRSFRFAARFFPGAEEACVARVYAYCRVTDDLVDQPTGDAAGAELLEEWVELSRRAYGGAPTGLPFLDRVMKEMAEAEVPFRYAAELAEGMRMDLRGESYATLQDLRRYTHRVASVVGLWLTELSGVHEPWVLERAAALGHAMQLTNIVRDVGEDLRRGRIYLPGDLLAKYGVSASDLREMAAGRLGVTPAYRALIEELLQTAEAEYRRAFLAIPALPRAFQRPVAVAAYVYRGIHAAIRRAGYDNFRLRATTSAPRKLGLAGRALWDLRSTATRVGVPGAASPSLAILLAGPSERGGQG